MYMKSSIIKALNQGMRVRKADVRLLMYLCPCFNRVGGIVCVCRSVDSDAPPFAIESHE